MTADFTSALPLRRTSWLVPGLGAVALLILGNDNGVVLCPFRRCTGGYCPLCGATRSVGAAVRLDLGQPLRLYPMLPVVMVLAVLALRPQLLDPPLRQRTMWAGMAVLVVVWAARLAIGDIPRPSGLFSPL